MGKIITVTGISGSGSRQFCQRYQEEGKKVKIYHMGDMLYEAAQNPEKPPVPLENLLDLHSDLLASCRDKVYEAIIRNLPRDKEENDMIFIDTHAEFFWNSVYTNAYSWRHLNQIPTDMFITIIDKPSAIKERQMKTRHGRVQTHDLRDILLWQNIEANVTEGWASNNGKPWYAFSSKQHPRIIDSLLENWFLVYASFSMTDADADTVKMIEGFKKDLRNLRKDIDGKETPIIDPAYIDIESGEGLSEKEIIAIDRQTVYRDMVWDVGNSTHVVAIYPKKTTPVSKGSSDETTRGMETGKFVYITYPKEKKSPFMYIANQVFDDPVKFLAFFKEHMRDALEYYKRK